MASSFALSSRRMRFVATTPEEARAWQSKAREKLFELMMGGHKPEPVDPNPILLKHEDVPDTGYFVEEMTINSLSDRKVHLWLAMQKKPPQAKLPTVLALHGHGGTGEQIIKGQGIYWYGKALAQRGYAVVTLDMGQHDLQHQGWTIMGERVWDALACVNYICSRPEIDPNKLGTVGLSLGGETAMYVGALDERMKITVSSGWLTTIENMKHGHCPCWNFPGLEENFDFSDIFSCIAPRHLIAEIGEQERAPGGFPVNIASQAFREIQKAYEVFSSKKNCLLVVHKGGHEFCGSPAFDWLDNVLKLL